MIRAGNRSWEFSQRGRFPPRTHFCGLLPKTPVPACRALRGGAREGGRPGGPSAAPRVGAFHGPCLDRCSGRSPIPARPESLDEGAPSCSDRALRAGRCGRGYSPRSRCYGAVTRRRCGGRRYLAGCREGPLYRGGPYIAHDAVPSSPVCSLYLRRATFYGKTPYKWSLPVPPVVSPVSTSDTPLSTGKDPTNGVGTLSPPRLGVKRSFW